jgi:hypothetical protein
MIRPRRETAGVGRVERKNRRGGFPGAGHRDAAQFPPAKREVGGPIPTVAACSSTPERNLVDCAGCEAVTEVGLHVSPLQLRVEGILHCGTRRALAGADVLAPGVRAAKRQAVREPNFVWSPL